MSPKIDIYTYSNIDENYSAEDDLYIGSFNTNTDNIIKIRIWNNRFGLYDVDEASNVYVTLFFDKFEDKILFENMTIKINDDEEFIPTPVSDKIIFPIGDISGKKNDGDSSSNNNKDNFKDIFIKISLSSKNLYENIKSMYIDLTHDTSESVV